MVDIHSHILWGMDDGAPTADISLQMLRMAVEGGTTDIVATPHANSEFEYDPDLITQRIQELTEASGGAPKIHRGCDLHLSFDNITDALERPGRYSINGKRYLLVECSDFNIGDAMDGVLERLIRADLVPIVTHPERNPILRRDIKKLERWVDQGCLVQVTALSILGGFGKSAGAAAHRLLSMGMVHAIASDAHDPVHRHPKLDEAFHVVAHRYGEETAQRLFVSNPGNIIQGKLVAEGKTPMEGPRKWWQFWSRTSSQ